MQKVEVSLSFLKKAHEAACPGWKKRIEDEFPDIFKSKTYEGIIGRKYTVIDNSYAHCIETGESVHAAIARIDIYRQKALLGIDVIIISEPYIAKVKFLREDPQDYTFINVLYKNNTFRVLFYEHGLIK